MQRLVNKKGWGRMVRLIDDSLGIVIPIYGSRGWRAHKI